MTVAQKSAVREVALSGVGTVGFRITGALGGVLAARLLGPSGRGSAALLVLMATALGTLATVGLQGGFHLPTAMAGWWGLAALTFLYGTAFTIMFTVLPKLGVVGNSAIMNVEPVFALVLAWLILGQAIAPIQVIGALIVVGAVMVLGMRRR